MVQPCVDAVSRGVTRPGDVCADAGLAHKFQISNWDAAILAAADQLGCLVVYSEDLSHGQDYDGVRVKTVPRH